MEWYLKAIIDSSVIEIEDIFWYESNEDYRNPKGRKEYPSLDDYDILSPRQLLDMIGE
jgi:hypothetical protein